MIGTYIRAAHKVLRFSISSGTWHSWNLGSLPKFGLHPMKWHFPPATLPGIESICGGSAPFGVHQQDVDSASQVGFGAWVAMSVEQAGTGKDVLDSVVKPEESSHLHQVWSSKHDSSEENSGCGLLGTDAPPTLPRARDQEKCPIWALIDSIYCLVLMLQGRSRAGSAHLIGGEGLSLVSLLCFGKVL